MAVGRGATGRRGGSRSWPREQTSPPPSGWSSCATRQMSGSLPSPRRCASSACLGDGSHARAHGWRCRGDGLDDLGLSDRPEAAELLERITLEERVRASTDRRWTVAFLVTLFAIHSARLEPDGTLLGYAAPAIAVVGDMALALLFASSSSRPCRCRATARRVGSSAESGAGIWRTPTMKRRRPAPGRQHGCDIACDWRCDCAKHGSRSRQRSGRISRRVCRLLRSWLPRCRCGA